MTTEALRTGRTAAALSLDRVLKKSPDAAFRVYDGHATIVLSSQAYVHVLNPAGSLLWEELDGQKSLAQLLDRVMEEYDVSRQQAEADMREFIGDLLDNGMVS